MKRNSATPVFLGLGSNFSARGLRLSPEFEFRGLETRSPSSSVRSAMGEEVTEVVVPASLVVTSVEGPKRASLADPSAGRRRGSTRVHEPSVSIEMVDWWRGFVSCDEEEEEGDFCCRLGLGLGWPTDESDLSAEEVVVGGTTVDFAFFFDFFDLEAGGASSPALAAVVSNCPGMTAGNWATLGTVGSEANAGSAARGVGVLDCALACFFFFPFFAPVLVVVALAVPLGAAVSAPGLLAAILVYPRPTAPATTAAVRSASADTRLCVAPIVIKKKSGSMQ